MSSVAASRLSEQLELRVVGHPRGSGTGPQPKLETGQSTFFQFRSDADTQRLIQTQGLFFHFNIITFIVGVVFKVTS